MNKTIITLEQKLNDLIDTELRRDINEIDDKIIMACCDGLLRIDNEKRYFLNQKEIDENIRSIFPAKKISYGNKAKKHIKIILIAAILAILLTIFAVGFMQRKYNILNFTDHSTILINLTGEKPIKKMNIGYIPNDFVLVDEITTKHIHAQEYTDGKNTFNITKSTNETSVDINTEYKDYEVLTINNIDYLIYGENEHGKGITWTDDIFCYCVSGDISNDELLKIAIHIQ